MDLSKAKRKYEDACDASEKADDDMNEAEVAYHKALDKVKSSKKKKKPVSRKDVWYE